MKTNVSASMESKFEVLEGAFGVLKVLAVMATILLALAVVDPMGFAAHHNGFMF